MLLAMPLVTLALLAAGVILYVRRRRSRDVRPSLRTLGWMVVPVAALVFVAVWVGLGLYTGGSPELLALCVCAAIAGGTALLRGRVALYMDELAERNPEAAHRTRVLINLVAVLVCVFLGFVALELPYNTALFSIPINFAAIEMGIILGALLVLFFLFQRHGAGLTLGVGICWGIGLAQYFVASFKAAAILPNDLFVLGTAAAVSGSYAYSVDGAVLGGLAFVMLASAVGSHVFAARAHTSISLVRRRVVNLGCALAAFVALAAGVTVPNYFDDLGVGMYYWYSLDYYREQGFLTTFVAVAQDLAIDVPEGYSADTAAETEQAYAATYDETLGTDEARLAAVEQFDELQPTVICIMDESFSDLSIFDGASWGYDGLTSFASVDGTFAQGSLAVSVLGGGTCNSEFEFLTGVPLAFVGDGKYPYSLYDLSDAPSLAMAFSELGYATTAIHPNYATNWNRDLAYAALGFDQFLTIDDFEGAETYHSGVSDEATFDKILELLEENDDPQFIFTVTMQNHSAYDQENIGDVTQYAVDGLSSYDNGRLSEYLACIDESERALTEFLEALAELDRPVVVLYFGDHQPALSTLLNDAIYSDESDEDLEYGLRTHETVYLMWANYDVAGVTEESTSETSVCYLSALLAQTIGMPLTDYQKAELVIHEELPSISLVGTQLADGTWVAYDSEDWSALPESYADLACITYLEFGSTVN